MIEFLTVKKALGERTRVAVLTFRGEKLRTSGDFERKAIEDALKIYRLLAHYLPNSTLIRLVKILVEKHTISL